MIRSNRCQSSRRSPILCLGGIGLCIGAFLAISTFGAAAPQDPGPTITCWDVFAYSCCDDHNTGTWCDGQWCPGTIEVNNVVRRIITVEEGWSFGEIPREDDGYCKFYAGVCDFTQDPPECIVDTWLQSWSCWSRVIPTGDPTCSTTR